MMFVKCLQYKILSDECEKSKTDIGLKQILLYNLHTQQNLRQHLALKVQYIPMYTLNIHKTQIVLVFHVLKNFQILKFSVAYLALFNQHNILILL